jgi:hypothetical protein
MSPLTKMFLDLKYENRKEGIMQGIKSIAKNMLKSKEPDEKIMKYTGITKEELEELKGEVNQIANIWFFDIFTCNHK